MHLLVYHLIWCPRRRKPVLVGPIADRCRELLVAKGAEQGWTVLTLAIAPDHVHLLWLPYLNEGELKVLLYIAQRTGPFGKNQDAISISQFVHGIRTKAGDQLDSGTGLSRVTVHRAINRLIELGLIIATTQRSDRHGDQPTIYGLAPTRPRPTTTDK